MNSTAPAVESYDAPDNVAIRVEGVSKTYTLWSTPSARLHYSLLRLVRKFLPASSSICRRLEARTNSMHRQFHALEQMSLEIKKGDSWGIIGVNGSGKSTLLKMISGNLRPSTGRIEVDGKIAILDYSSGLHGGFTGRENVYLKAATHGMSSRQIDEKFDSIAAFADIGDFIDQPVKTYSSGMIARLGFAIMAHIDADIIITDEALAVGDAFFVQKCMAFIRDFLKHGTFLFVSHSTNDVVSLCENALWLEHGKVREIGKAKHVAESYLSSQSLKSSKHFLETQKSSLLGAVEKTAPLSNTKRENASEISQPQLSELTATKPARIIRDPRLEFINRSPWRNDIEMPEFAMAKGFGVGGATIEDVAFEDETGATLSWIIGGEMVRLKIRVRAEIGLSDPIIGFQVKDRLGQTLFADNTFLATIEAPIYVVPSQHVEAEFLFQIPLLPVGEYAIRAAVAAGKESENAMLHCIDTALAFRSVASVARHGLVGVPMQYIRIGVIDSPDSNDKSAAELCPEVGDGMKG